MSDFGGQCLPPGEYIPRWAAELNFGVHGQIWFFGQAGPHDNGGGDPNDGFQSNPGNAIGLGECFDTISGSTGLHTGVNFVLGGEAGDCVRPPCISDCGDVDGDGDSDGDDFFAFLDLFAGGDDCADLDEDGDHDSDDFFGYLASGA